MPLPQVLMVVTSVLVPGGGTAQTQERVPAATCEQAQKIMQSGTPQNVPGFNSSKIVHYVYCIPLD